MVLRSFLRLFARFEFFCFSRFFFLSLKFVWIIEALRIVSKSLVVKILCSDSLIASFLDLPEDSPFSGYRG